MSIETLEGRKHDLMSSDCPVRISRHAIRRWKERVDPDNKDPTAKIEQAFCRSRQVPWSVVTTLVKTKFKEYLEYFYDRKLGVVFLAKKEDDNRRIVITVLTLDNQPVKRSGEARQLSLEARRKGIRQCKGCSATYLYRSHTLVDKERKPSSEYCSECSRLLRHKRNRSQTKRHKRHEDDDEFQLFCSS